MDPVSQGVFGSLWAQSASASGRLRLAAVAGFVAGMAADLDILIRSPRDPLLFIDFHRHFTHSIAFAPAGGLLVALLLWPLLGRPGFARLYLFCFLGYLSHGVLDAFTSYGTHLWWPFSEQRVALNWISVVDPLFTLPLIALLIAACWRQQRRWHLVAVAWVIAYLGLGALQQQRAEQALLSWAEGEAIEVRDHVAKPAFANLILWRGVVHDGETLYALAIRQLPWGGTWLYPGAQVDRVRSEAFPADSRLGSDLRRFEAFSEGWLFRYPPREQGDWFVGDFRYAMDPASERPLWGVRFEPDALGEGVRFERLREVDQTERERFMERLLGRTPGG